MVRKAKSLLLQEKGPEEHTLFSVFLTDEMLEKQLNLTKKYSTNQIKNKQLYNCINLTAVLLGLIEKEEQYLDICLNRDRTTLWHELDLITYDACKKAGIKYLGKEYSGTAANMIRVKITEENLINPFIKVFAEVGKKLQNNYATPFGILFDDGSSHLVLLRKNDKGIIYIIDPQDVDRNGSYPLIQHRMRPLKYKSINSIYYFHGPSIDKDHLKNAKSNIANIVMKEEPVYIEENISPIKPIGPPQSPEEQKVIVNFFAKEAKRAAASVIAKNYIDPRNILLLNINELKDDPLQLMRTLRETRLPEETMRSIFKKAQKGQITRNELNAILSAPIPKESSLYINTVAKQTQEGGKTRRQARRKTRKARKQ